MKKGLLLVSFGTSFPGAFKLDIEPIEEAIKAKFEGVPSYRAFGSGFIIKKLKKSGEVVLSVSEALDKMIEDGITDFVIQPIYMINGIEYERMLAALDERKEKISSAKIGEPLLSSEDDLRALSSLSDLYERSSDKEALVLMGHGSEHISNALYAGVNEKGNNNNLKNIFIGTVEGTPDFEWIKGKLKEAAIEKVYLVPFLLVAGDHVNNDMAGDEEDSWMSQLMAEGYDVEATLRGLGSLEFIQQIFAEHALKAKDYI